MSRAILKICVSVLFCLLLGACSRVPTGGGTAPSKQPEQAFKLAQYGEEPDLRLAILVQEQLFDLPRLDALVPAAAGDREPPIPPTMLELIGNYTSIRGRLYQLANYASREANEEALSEALLDPSSLHWQPPVHYPWNLLNVAVNYREHGAEMGQDLDTDYQLDEPFIFAKSPKACLIGSGETVHLPPGRDQIDWEVELAVIMGKKATRVSRENAREHVFGYTLMLDISDRGPKKRKDPRFNVDWFSGKSRDGFAPIGPFIVPAEFVSDPNDLNLRLSVNQMLMQDSNTQYMVHDVDDLIAYITSIQTLEPGDIISTGTPPGVGAGRQPPVFLHSGDVITAEVEGISEIRTPIQ